MDDDKIDSIIQKTIERLLLSTKPVFDHKQLSAREGAIVIFSSLVHVVSAFTLTCYEKESRLEVLEMLLEDVKQKVKDNGC